MCSAHSRKRSDSRFGCYRIEGSAAAGSDSMVDLETTISESADAYVPEDCMRGVYLDVGCLREID